jgi:hypothetical protein
VEDAYIRTKFGALADKKGVSLSGTTSLSASVGTLSHSNSSGSFGKFAMSSGSGSGSNYTNTRTAFLSWLFASDQVCYSL